MCLRNLKSKSGLVSMNGARRKVTKWEMHVNCTDDTPRRADR